MAIDLLDVIRNDSAIKSGGFTGAIFLTFSLNLTFFEQILAPALDQAGCSNVLILADPDGYQQALQMGINSIDGVGLRYVCVPVPRTGQGLQHAKMLFMVGKNRGRLLVGSGNLTFHGYGRNLEMYSHFEYSTADSSSNITPFLQAWELIQKLAGDSEFSKSACQQIDKIQENVLWLKNVDTGDPILWHNYERSLLDQLAEWRNTQGLTGPAKKISAISPYYDHDLSAIKRLAKDTSPAKLQIHLDPGLTNLDGKQATQTWKGWSPKINAFSIGAGGNETVNRHVHAKAIIGQENNGVWCITGSANLSYAALLADWQSGGNLELVTFLWDENPKAFDYLLNDPMVQVLPIELANITITETEPSERTTEPSAGIYLVDLYLHGDQIEGQLSRPLTDSRKDAQLYLQRENIHIAVHFLDDLHFQAHLEDSAKEAELARLEIQNIQTPYRWIDYPEILAQYGARGYQIRVKGKIETLLGAEKLFTELLNFLWGRVEAGEDRDEDPRVMRRHSHRNNPNNKGSYNGPLPPGSEAFITDEVLVQTLHLGMEHHLPYDRSLLSLQDLLSIVLLRLTTPTQTTSSKLDSSASELTSESQTIHEAEKIDILKRLRDYLIFYCKRYSSRLTNEEFLRSLSPEVLFQNHYTLGRVLIEFANKTRDKNVFNQKDLSQCFWLVWAPLTTPRILDSSHFRSTLEILLREYGKDVVQTAWKKTGMANLSVVILSEAMRQPPSWRAGIWDRQSVGHFALAQEWIIQAKRLLGENAFLESGLIDTTNVFGIPDIAALYGNTSFNAAYLEYVRSTFEKIENYRLPLEEKYSLLIELSELDNSQQMDAAKRNELLEKISAQGLGTDLEKYETKRVPILSANESEDVIYCPKCAGRQTTIAQQSIARGALTLCSNSRDAWIYLISTLPDQIAF